MELIFIEQVKPGSPVGRMSWDQFCQYFNLYCGTIAPMFRGATYYGESLFVYTDTEKKYNDANKNDLFKIYRVSLQKFSQIVSHYLDNQLRGLAHQRGYNSVESCISFMTSKNKQRAKEAKFMHDLRDEVFEKAFAYIAQLPADDDVLALESYDAQPLLDAIPAIAWPENL